MRVAAVVLVIALVLAVTNPGVDQFVDWAVQELRAEHEAVDLLEALGEAVARPVLRNTTERSSYGVLSVFTVHGVGQEKNYIGIAGQFFPLDGRELDIDGLEQ